MARRARDRRKAIPGYDEFRPSSSERARDHRRVRHAANQMLRTTTDVEELAPLPEVRPDHHHDSALVEPAETPRTRFTVGKTKFWKRRDRYQDFKARIDSTWPDTGPART